MKAQTIRQQRQSVLTLKCDGDKPGAFGLERTIPRSPDEKDRLPDRVV